jgi:hypothetical protein
MDPEDVADLLDFDLAVKIGEEKGTDRIHRLFYSHDDRQCFVAIQDDKTKMLITILPVDYYQTIAARISRSALKKAETLVSAEGNLDKSEPDFDVQVGTSGGDEDFRLRATIRDSKNAERQVRLGCWPSAPYRKSVERLLGDQRFLDEMQKRLRPVLLNGERAFRFYVRIGKKGEGVWVEIPTAEDGSMRIIQNIGGESPALLTPSAFRITGILAMWGKDARRINLGAWPVGASEGSVEALLRDREFVEAIKQRVQPEIKDGEYVESYVIRLGKKGEWWSVSADEEGRPIPK